MSYFLSAENLRLGEEIEISGEEAKHIMLSRRIKIGEKINLQGPDEKRFEAEILDLNKKSINLKILQEISTPKEPEAQIILFQALVKEKALEYIIQKCTELGVAKIVIFQSVRAPFSLQDEQKKIGRLKKISQEAAKQCDRVKSPPIEFLQFEKILEAAGDLDRFFILDKKGGQTFPQAAQKNNFTLKNIGFFIGPEGGLTRDEILKLSQTKNAAVISMGPRLLRADTAALSALSIIQSLFGDLK
ncbi:16S rRNA (uracil(1498)-N(3))-methyltransferase [Patescibacteria group bacterium]|nr:MAG: 16S rRNA (uracil(1498)-N(3))-methyltransferase [Patescibacteria group bacterium]